MSFPTLYHVRGSVLCALLANGSVLFRTPRIHIHNTIQPLKQCPLHVDPQHLPMSPRGDHTAPGSTHKTELAYFGQKKVLQEGASMVLAANGTANCSCQFALVPRCLSNCVTALVWP